MILRKMAAALLFLLLAGCMPPGEKDSGAGMDPVAKGNKYASGFRVEDFGSFRLVHIYSPWQNSRDVSFTYLLTGDPSGVADSLKYLPCIRIPVEQVVTLSTTHVAMIHALNRSGTIRGVSGSQYIYNREVREQIGSGEVVDVGYEQGLNYETLVSLDADVVFIYGVEGSARGMAEKLAELGIPAVFCGDYLESHPLGRAEWIRFFGEFFDLDREAGQYFARIDSAYNALTSLAASVREKPGVLTGLPWKESWYVAGGRSFAARLIRDAGGAYLWADDPSTEATPLDLESVFSRAMDADIWINPGAARSLDELRRFDPRFGELPVLEQGDVYNNDARTSEGGGNDYWESGALRVDLVLADLIRVFHPDLLADHSVFYYRKLK